MTDINRRKMIMGVGAASSLVALSTQATGQAKKQVCINLDPGTLAEVLGTGFPHEVEDIPDVNGRRYPYPERTRPPVFTANRLCLIYLKFVGAKVRIKHAYFMPTNNQSSVVIQQFSNMITNGAWISPLRAEENFDRFYFGSPTMIYMYLDNPPEEVEFDEDNLIQLSTFGARKVLGKKEPKDPHNCFLNPSIDAGGTWPGKKLLVLENWYTHADGATIGNRHQKYSMNIHLKMKCYDDQSGGYADIPMVLDPDTDNNGTGP